MKSVLCSVVILATCLALLATAPEGKAPKPQYDQKGQLLWPSDYRDRMFLSAGSGMNYNPGPAARTLRVNTTNESTMRVGNFIVTPEMDCPAGIFFMLAPFSTFRAAFAVQIPERAQTSARHACGRHVQMP